MAEKAIGKSNRQDIFENVTKRLVAVYETGGVPLVLIVFGASIVAEVEFDVFFDGSSVLPQREIFLIGIGLVLAGVVCWRFSVYMVQQRASEKPRVLEAIVESASKSCEPDAFFSSAADFLTSVDFRITVADTRAAQAPDTVKSPNGDSEKNKSPAKDASRSINSPDISEAT